MARRFVHDETGASDSGESHKGEDEELLELEKVFAATGGYDPEGGFIVTELSEGEGDTPSPRRTRRARTALEKHVIRLFALAGLDDLDDETEEMVFAYAKRHLQTKKKVPPPPPRKKKRKGRLKRRRAVSSSSADND